MKQVSDVMTRGVRTLTPETSMLLAAQAMEEMSVGSVPVCDGQRLLGMVTDRDLIVRGMARGMPADSTPLAHVMSTGVTWCYEDQPVDEAAELMRASQIRRLPVIDHSKQLVGMLTLGDIAAKSDAGQAGQALQDISHPAAPDRSGLSAASGDAGGGADEDQPGTA